MNDTSENRIETFNSKIVLLEIVKDVTKEI